MPTVESIRETLEKGTIMSEYERIGHIISPIAEKFGVERVSLFGSRAKGNFTDRSDYDFLISKGEIKSLFTYSAFINALEEAFGTHVDVVTDTSSDQKFINMISQEGILLYERKR